MYEALKRRLIERFSESEELRLKKLLSDIELSDQRPSHLLAEMRKLASGKVSDELLKTLWLQRLPTQVKIILTASGDSLVNLACMADKIMEVAGVGKDNFGCIASTDRSRTRSFPSTNTDTPFEKIEKQIAALTLKVENLTKNRERSRSRNNHRSVSDTGLKPNPDKIKAIDEFPRPKTVQELRRFLAMCNFYRRCIPKAADTQAVLNEYMKNGKKNDKTPINWTEEAIVAFQNTKADLVNATTLFYPDPTARIQLRTDASDTAIGAVIEQQKNEIWQLLAFFSRKLGGAQKRYSTYDRELLAIYESIKHFRYFLEGRVFIILTDHKPLIFAFTQSTDKLPPRRTRQLDYISQFTTDIKYVMGSDNTVADALSRVASIHAPPAINYNELSGLQANDEELLLFRQNTNSGLKIELVSMPTTDVKIYCDVSTGTARPFLVKAFRRKVFDSLHNLSHPGVRATIKLIKKRFVWPSINRDCSIWARSCVSCQKSKIGRHVSSPIGSFDAVSERFLHIHIDLVGPLPSSRGFTYCLTVVDRFSRWPEVYFLKDITAESVAQALYEGWIVRYGVPETITTDQGRQFESTLFRATSVILGFKRIRTTACHPAANGLVERFHRVLKAAIKCYNTERWTEVIPSILLGIRASVKEDIQSTPAEMVFGTTIRLPNEFFSTSKIQTDPMSFVTQLKNVMNCLRPVPTSNHSKKRVFVHKSLPLCKKVFVRVDRVKSPLERPYDGPYEVISRAEKNYVLRIKGKTVNITIDRLKPCFETVPEDELTSKEREKVQIKQHQRVPTPADTSTAAQVTSTHTRSGRAIKLPVRFR
ncbi:hypothetical protein QTP88_028347 [Uroleucon formosanum]